MFYLKIVKNSKNLKKAAQNPSTFFHLNMSEATICLFTLNHISLNTTLSLTITNTHSRPTHLVHQKGNRIEQYFIKFIMQIF